MTYDTGADGWDSGHLRVRLHDAHSGYEVDLILLYGIERLERLPRLEPEFLTTSTIRWVISPATT